MIDIKNTPKLELTPNTMAKRYNKENGRKCMRLRGYDYSREGLYFITIMVQKRLHLFGEIKNGQMILNHAGEMVHEWYYEIENKFPDKRCHAMVVMPNHFHCIIENTKCDAHVERDEHDEWDAHEGTSHSSWASRCQRGFMF